MKHFKPAIGFLILGVFFAWGLQSCKTKTFAMPTYRYIYIPVPYAKHDTVQPKQLTEAERKAMMRKFFKSNYDEFMSPQFDRLESIINKQANSIGSLTETLKQMRIRSIHRTDSMQDIQGKKDSVNLDLRRELLKKETTYANDKAESVKQNTISIAYLKGVAELLEWGFASLWVVFISFGLVAYFWYKKLKRDIKSVNYA